MKPAASWTAAGAPLLVNLAAAPFVNRRPVQRFAAAAWIAAVLLAATNVLLWMQYRHDSTALRARLGDTRAAIEEKSRHLMAMNQELQALGLAGQNAQVEFLNGRIAERTFPWSLLFERVGETLPDGVRILGLNPVFRDAEKEGRLRRRMVAREDEVVDLKFQGVARTDEELYRLIDAFFSSPVFDAPRLHQENRGGDGVAFTVDVAYRPWHVEEEEVEVEEESHRPAIAAADESTAEDGGDQETDPVEEAAEGSLARRANRSAAAGKALRGARDETPKERAEPAAKHEQDDDAPAEEGER